MSAIGTALGLLVAETFTSLQGEGPSTGQPAAFIRLSRCNLACAFCDTPYTWDWSRFNPSEEAVRRSPDDLAAWVTAQPGNLVVITGGEPLIQQQALLPLAKQLAATGRRIEIETNGTIAPSAELAELVASFNVSPKLSGSGVAEDKRIIPYALCTLAASGKAIFKFVVCGPSELAEITELEAAYHLAPVWVMPEGTTATAVIAGMQALAERALAQGWNLSSRLHVLLWGDQRGY
jgi:organic radical activating enzyme